jgi:hypothetical protein
MQVRGGRGRCSASKLYLLDLWNNSDFEISQKVNAQNGISHSGLQKTGCEKFALKLHTFLNETPGGDGLPICPFEKRTRWVGILTARNNAPVSTKYLSFVNSSVKKINPALAGKCIGMAVSCVGMIAEPKVIRWLISFLTKHRAKHTCEPCGHSCCEIYKCHCQGFGMNKSQGRKGGDF